MIMTWGEKKLLNVFFGQKWTQVICKLSFGEVRSLLLNKNLGKFWLGGHDHDLKKKIFAESF